MARAKAQANGNGRLEEAMTNLLQSQALLVQTQAEFVAQKATTDREVAELRREMAELDRASARRFARIEAILMEHSRTLQALPEAIREKIGFKPPEPKRPAG
jgi:hypothetical protein